MALDQIIIKNRKRLEDYLQELKTCPDDKLRDELGVYDNWPILLNADFEKLTKYLEESGKYLLTEKRGDQIYFFINTANTTQIAVCNFLKYLCGRDYGSDWSEEEIKKQSTEYNATGILQPRHSLYTPLEGSLYTPLEGTAWIREIAKVIDDLGQHIIKENIPACFPNSIGWEYRRSKIRRKDCISRLVYNQPK